MGFSMVWVIDLLIHLAGLRPHTVALDDDTTVHCWISSSLLLPSSAIRSKEKKAKPLLLIHGFRPRGTWQWSRQVWPLAARFDLVVPDLLFFGGSTTRSPIRSEAFQAAAIARLLDVLGIGPPHRASVSVAGTSYGGFVAYHVARALGPEWVERVVIASSDVLKGPDDDRALLERAGGARSIDELLLPRTTADLRRLARLAVYRLPRFVPEFIFRDMLRVNVHIYLLIYIYIYI
ncbi:alpha/beta hydrolase fold [Musa troglodytarum]|uniref:Alpha/beta hydrolase fold n=1 Tax=Musa troglodytarum TaxID=320322 RepID=A0A9E7ENE9_9LILI|nr:alpha/beta hydrolase fold [Musa troglodytarum]